MTSQCANCVCSIAVEAGDSSAKPSDVCFVWSVANVSVGLIRRGLYLVVTRYAAFGVWRPRFDRS